MGVAAGQPKIGWLFGWLSFCYLAAGVVTVANALASTALMPLFGIQPDENTARVITLVVLVIEAVLVVLSTRLVGLITSAAVGLELVIVVVLTLGLLVAVAVTGDGAVSNLTSRGIAEGSPLFRFRWRIDGRDDHGHRNPRRLRLLRRTWLRRLRTPIAASRARSWIVVAAAVLGMVFVIALTIAIKDIPQATAADRRLH